MRGLRAALVFLTRVPIPIRGEVSLALGIPWYPLAGALVGTVVGATAAGLWHLVPPLVAAAVAVAFGLLVTGVFHEDGLADTFDAFVGGWAPEDRLRILKDPLHGSYGVAALCATIVVHVVAIGSLGAPSAIVAAVIAAATIGRVAAVALLMLSPAAVPGGLGAGNRREVRPARAAAGIAAGIAVTALVTGWWVAPFLAAGVAAAAVMGWWARRKIGGITGDILGAAEQVAECLVLVVATGIASRWPVWWA